MRLLSIKSFVEADAGMTTAEYAVGTLAATGLAGLLLKLLTSNEVRDLIWNLFSRALTSIAL